MLRASAGMVNEAKYGLNMMRLKLLAPALKLCFGLWERFVQELRFLLICLRMKYFALAKTDEKNCCCNRG